MKKYYPVLLLGSVQLKLLTSLRQEDHPLPGWGGDNQKLCMAASLLLVYSPSKGQTVGLAASPDVLSAITAVSKKLLRFMLRACADLGFGRYILQGYHYQGFRTGMSHSCDGRKPVIRPINAIGKKLVVLLLKCAPLWSVLHPHPYLNGSQIKCNASQSDSFHPPLFILLLSPLVILIKSMLSG